MATNNLVDKEQKTKTHSTPEIKKSLSNNPTSFYEALVDRYLNAHEFNVPSFVHFKMPPPTDFELDGCKLGKLKTLGLDHKYIYKAGIPVEGLAKLCPNATSLHLARNNLQTWSEIELILREFPQLEDFNLRANIFTMSHDELSNQTPPILCPKLQTLDLTHTQIGWPQIQCIALQCPQLKGLEIGSNNLDEVSAEALVCLQNIEVLVLSSNNIKSWDEVLKLGVLPKLETLHLSYNPICFSKCGKKNSEKQIITDSNAIQELGESIDQLSTTEQNQDEDPKPKPLDPTPLFPSLTTISLAEVNICKWDELDIIAELPVTNMRIKDIPLAHDIPQEDRRKLFLAWFPCITKLNGSVCDEGERIKAERFTIRYFHTLDYKPKCLPRLIKMHGDLKPLVDIDISFGYKEFVKVEFIYQSKVWRVQKISVKQTVRELLMGLSREFKRPYRTMQLFHLQSSKKAQFDKMQELTLSSLPLSRFDIHDGDQIIIS